MARFSLALACVLAVFSTATGQAAAGCPICDQYTLDIPDPKGGGNDGGNDGGSTTDPEPAPAPTEPAPAAPAPAPAPAAPAPAPAPASAAADEQPSKGERKRKRRHRAPKPSAKPELAGADRPAPPELADSEPLVYDADDSTSEAALAGLGSPATIALLASLLAAGGAVAVARRRSAGD